MKGGHSGWLGPNKEHIIRVQDKYACPACKNDTFEIIKMWLSKTARNNGYYPHRSVGICLVCKFRKLFNI